MAKRISDTRLPIVLPLRLTALQYRQLERLAECEERTRSAVIRELINKASKRLPKEGRADV